MSKIEEMVKDLPPDLQQEVEDFVEFLLAKCLSFGKGVGAESAFSEEEILCKGFFC